MWEKEESAPIRAPAGARKAPEPSAEMPSCSDGCSVSQVGTAAHAAGQAHGCVWVGSAIVVPVFPFWCQSLKSGDLRSISKF